MDVMAVGFVVRKEPSGFTVVAWHRHGGSAVCQCSDDMYERLTVDEMADAVFMHLNHYLPGDPCPHSPWPEPRLF